MAKEESARGWTKGKPATVDGYIAAHPKQIQTKLTAVRKAIRRAVPKAEEVISYRIPHYKFHGRLLYFAAMKNHYSLFAITDAVMEEFANDLGEYGWSGKGTLRLPYDKPVPTRLIERIAKFRAKENLAREKARL